MHVSCTQLWLVTIAAMLLGGVCALRLVDVAFDTLVRHAQADFVEKVFARLLHLNRRETERVARRIFGRDEELERAVGMALGARMHKGDMSAHEIELLRLLCDRVGVVPPPSILDEISRC